MLQGPQCQPRRVCREERPTAAATLRHRLLKAACPGAGGLSLQEELSGEREGGSGVSFGEEFSCFFLQID